MRALKEHFYSNDPQILLDSQENICREIENISAKMLVKAFRNLKQRRKDWTAVCIENEGDQIEKFSPYYSPSCLACYVGTE